MILHSLEPWLLARYLPNLERTACNSVAHAGFECWFPTYLEIRPLPLNRIPPRKRHLAAWYVRELRRPRFPGYLLLRPLPFCRFDVNNLSELKGCGSAVSFGGKIAKIEDFDVEIMRLAEARGVFDQHIGIGRRRYTVLKTGQAEWISQSRKALNLDPCGEFRLFIDSLGRIARIIAHDQGHETGLSTYGEPLARGHAES